ncbi:MAG: tetraacyldisaccharide 4'-kinase, partial [Cellvibrio sp.]
MTMVKTLLLAPKIALRTSLGFMCLVLAACQQPVAKNSVATQSPARPAWQLPDDPEAKTYLSNCEADFRRVASELDSFATLKRGTDSALLDKLNKMDQILDRQLSTASLYSNVHPNGNVRTAAEECEQHFVAINTDISLSRTIYDQVKQIDPLKLGVIDKRYVEHTLLDYRRSGVDKDQATRDKIKQLNEEINLIGQEFDKNYREGGKKIEVASVKELKGLPKDYIERHKPNAEGKIILSTDAPDYIPVMQYAHNDALRERMYRTYRDMAYPENKTVLENLIAKRYQLAQLLGYPD